MNTAISVSSEQNMTHSGQPECRKACSSIVIRTMDASHCIAAELIAMEGALILHARVFRFTDMYRQQAMCLHAYDMLCGMESPGGGTHVVMAQQVIRACCAAYRSWEEVWMALCANLISEWA